MLCFHFGMTTLNVEALEADVRTSAGVALEAAGTGKCTMKRYGSSLPTAMHNSERRKSASEDQQGLADTGINANITAASAEPANAITPFRMQL